MPERTGHKVLVCGGRDFRDTALFDRFMCEVDNHVCIGEIIHGGANGADTMAGCWGDKHNIPVTVYKADWSRYGRSAGPKRNEKMLYEGKPDYVVAFPGGRGTAHMVSIARKAGVTVFEAKVQKARCPECLSEDVALVVVPNVGRPKEPTFCCECACGHQWDVDA